MYFKQQINLGIDLDGVVISNFPIWRDYFNDAAVEHDHKELITQNDSPYWDFFPHICKKCWDEVLFNPDMIMNYPVVPLAKEILTWLNEIGASLHVITSRPNEVVEATYLWVKKNFPDIFSSVTVTTNKLETCKDIGIKYHLDDAPHHIKALQTQDQVIPIIFDHPYNSHLEGLRVRGWIEYASNILNLVTKNG